MQIAKGNNLPRVKVSNQASIRRMIYYYGPITRSEIAERLHLTLPTITTNINSMIASGIVKELNGLDEAIKSMGRKAYPVDIIADSRYFLGVEMRGTLRSLTVTDYRGEIIYFDKDETPYSEYDVAIESTCAMIRKCFAECSVTIEDIAGIGFCLPGLVDAQNGILLVHPGYNWTNKNICEDVARLTGYNGPISVENNACARAYATQLFRRQLLNNVPSFAYMYVSTGIASPFILNNFSELSAPIGAGEAGHMVMNANGPKCRCGNNGCLEAFSSDHAVIEKCAQAMERGEAPILKKICECTEPAMKDVLEAQKQGDTSVQAIIDEAVFYLGLAIANIDNFVRPHSIFIEGVLFSNDNNRDLLLKTIHHNLYRATLTDINFFFIEADEFSGAKCAAAVAIRNDLGHYIE
jgi:predicted NBD/HSP70 family sugar kinase